MNASGGPGSVTNETDAFTALLQRLRGPDTRARREKRPRVTSTPAPTVKHQSTISADMTALLQVWAGGAQSEPADAEKREFSSPPSSPGSPAASAQHAAGESSLLALSAFAPSTDFLPRLVRDTIGRSSGTQPKRVRPLSCVVVDVETTGFSARRNELVEVGCVELRWVPPAIDAPVLGEGGGTEVSTLPSATASMHSLSSGQPSLLLSPHDSSASATSGFWTRGARVFHRRIRPSSPAAISAAATAVHGITWDMVKDCDTWPVVADELVAFLRAIAASNGTTCKSPPGGDRVRRGGQWKRVDLPPLVAHNSHFDRAFLAEHLQRCGYDVVWDPDYPITCSLQWSRRAYPHVAGSLNALCAFFCIEGAAERAAGYHGALVDAILTAKLFLQLCRRYEERARAVPP